MTLRLGVLASGAGTNFQAILDAIAAGRLDARVELLISNVPGALVLERAAGAGVPSRCIDHRRFEQRLDFDEAILEASLEHGVELIVLAGFMRILGPRVLDAFPNRILNIHPALLPSFPGTAAVKEALARGVTISGCTIHIVDPGMDTGPIIAQAAVPVLPDDDERSLSARIQEQERLLYPRVLQAIAEGRLVLRDGRPHLRTMEKAHGSLQAPLFRSDGGLP